MRGTWFRITRAGSDPFFWTDEPADGRWQRGSVVRAIYLGDDEATVWAEWFRHTAEAGRGVTSAPWRAHDRRHVEVGVAQRLVGEIDDPFLVQRAKHHAQLELPHARPLREAVRITEPVDERDHPRLELAELD